MPNRSRSGSTRSSPNHFPHPHYDPSRNLLLDPRFLIQLAGMILAAAALYYGIVGNQDALAKEQASLAKEQLRQGQLLDKIEGRLPNTEALDLRLDQMEKRISSAETQVKAFDDWMRITQVQLARQGIGTSSTQ